MKTTISFCLVLTLACILMARISQAAPNCNKNEVDVDPSKCMYGMTRDWCRHMVCAKGPGDVCGGRWMQRGTCSTGLYCNCSRCTGCSPLGGCFESQFC
ncbi:unnamed protein product [Meganyctiphanes norvegica]|uniref:Uncharacterized protein n=1 Tax=Meganyctiphanes norvegica TaxID=48144 RepID=A0AAV2Q2V1_MEGNR